MAGSINKVIILGNLGKEPEIRTFPNGGKVCNFPIATSENWKDKSLAKDKKEHNGIMYPYYLNPLSILLRNI